MRIDYNSFTKRWIRPPAHQFPVGSIVFKGYQGSGKTLSMVHYVLQLRKEFPKCLIFSNIMLRGLKDAYYFDDNKGLAVALSAQNGADGVVVLLDEAHLFFGRKDGISLDVLTAISQQRKDRRRIVLSSQIWEELDISLRKQVKHIVSCKCMFSKIQVNTISDGESLTYDKLEGAYVARKLYTEVFKHNQELYRRYDTFQKIVNNREYHRTESTPVLNTNIVQVKNLKK